MLLSDLLPELQEVGIGIVGRWQINNRKGLTLGNPQKYFPFPEGPQYPVDCTKQNDPDLSDKEVEIIRRRFGIGTS